MRGFSLVEISIVLVILGLLTGGILAGQSLIRASELRAVTSEYQRYSTAVNTFRDKYFAVPGDFNAATKFWGRLNGNADCVTNSSAAVASPGACDGDGGGTLGSPAAASQSGERFQFWRQLANAGLIDGTYTGLAGTGAGGRHAVIGTNVPRSKLGNAGWSTTYVANYAGDGSAYAFDYQNSFNFGGQLTTIETLAAAIKPEEAWNIDTKLDDGRPAYGKMMIYYWNNACATGGATNADLANSVYNLTNNTIACAVYFVKQF
jgi:prepilin-type N-terminal cleavage/methylation domain-containing protein